MPREANPNDGRPSRADTYSEGDRPTAQGRDEGETSRPFLRLPLIPRALTVEAPESALNALYGHSVAGTRISVWSNPLGCAGVTKS